jgi:FAD-linked oxidoreductase
VTAPAARFRNWSGLVECRPARLEEPADLEGIARVLRESAGAGRRVRVAGGGHSFTELAATDGTLVRLRRFQGIEDPAAPGAAWVRGGTRLRELNAGLSARGLALENLGDIDRQTIAGAVGTGTHGTGAGLGSLSTQVTALTLVTAAGEVIECSEMDQPEVFRAAQVSLGALGVLARLRLRVVPAFRLEGVRRRVPLDACLESLGRERGAHRHFELYWFPYADSVQTKAFDPTAEPARGRLARWADEWLAENIAFGALCCACRAWPALSPRASRLAARLQGEARDVLDSPRAFCTRRLVRFQEMEYGVPQDAAADVIREVREWVARRRPAVCFPLECRFVKADAIPLSPAFGRDSAFVAVHAYRGMEFRDYFDGVEAIFRNHQGRPHWGKLHTAQAPELRRLYPLWDDFQAVRARLDPGRLFGSPYLERLLG